MVDHVHVAWRCSCPSRSQPCKHALALLVMWVRGQVPAAPAPTRVASWVDGHARREAAAGAAAPLASAAADGAERSDDVAEPAAGRASTSSAAATSASPGCATGWSSSTAGSTTGCAPVSPTRRWPATPRGTSSPPASSTPGPARWPTASAAWPASSGPGPTGTRSCWPSSACCTCWPRPASALPELPAPLADAVATACGWQVRQADVLAGVPDTDTLDRRRAQRHPRGPHRGAPHVAARAEASGRWAMVLSFAAYRQSLDDVAARSAAASSPTCTAIPGRRRGRSSARSTTDRPASRRRAARRRRRRRVRRASATALAAEPWVERVPVTVLRCADVGGGRWVLDRRHRHACPGCRRAGPGHRRRRVGGRPSRSPSSGRSTASCRSRVHLPDRALDVGPRADLSFVSAA